MTAKDLFMRRSELSDAPGITSILSATSVFGDVNVLDTMYFFCFFWDGVGIWVWELFIY